MVLAHSTALHLTLSTTLRCLLLLPSTASWVSREPPVSAHRGMKARGGSVQCQLVRQQLILGHTQ